VLKINLLSIKNMSERGSEGGINDKDVEFKAPADFTKADSRDTDQEKKFEVEIRKEDIEGIARQMEEEYRTDHGQRLAFEMAALAELKKNASEEEKEIIGEVEFPYAYYEMTEKRVKEDTRLDPTRMKDFVDSKGKERYKDWTTDKILEEKAWGQMFSESYRKDYVDFIDPDYADSKKIKKERELSLSEWADMKNDLKEKMGAGDWHNAIPRAGHMCKLVGFERFRKEIKFSEADKDGIIEEINTLRKGKAGEEKEKRRKGDPWELASRIRYVAEFLPELKSRIELDQDDLEMMENFLDKKREEAEKNGEKSWDVAYQLCNMKIVEGLVKKEEIKIAEKKN